MPNSMTGFANTVITIDNIMLNCEIKTNNQRFLDISISLPDALKPLEKDLVKKLNQTIQRGKVLCKIEQTDMTKKDDLTVDPKIVRQILKSSVTVGQIMHDEFQVTTQNSLSVYEIMKLMRNYEPNLLINLEKHTTDIISLVEETLNRLLETRRAEGERLSQFILERCKQLQEILHKIRDRRIDILDQIKQKLNKTLQDIDLNLNAERLEQEIVLLAQKQDIDEELDRVSSHLNEVTQVFARQEPIGRRLDFLMQELNREANTLGSKTANIENLNDTVDMKVLIEQMREQIQNLE